MTKENEPVTKTKDELVKLLKTNLREFNKFRELNGFEPLDLSEARFQGATLTGAKLKDIDFTAANFEYATIIAADLSNCILKNALLLNANMTKSNLSGADLEAADLTGALLESANLDNANLSLSLFSQANLTNVSLNQTDLESTNFCSANLSDTNLKNALNLRHCIFDKFTRWPVEQFMPRDFNPGKGKYGSEEDFSITVTEADDSYEDTTMSPEALKLRLMEDVVITGKGLPEIEKKQILLDRKLDYVIASLKNIGELMNNQPARGDGYDEDGYSDYNAGTGAVSGNLNAKLQELDDKIESVASILTRFPVKSLEETYKLIDVIKRIEEAQGNIHGQMSQSVLEISRANQEIQSILGGKLRASYISGLDKMFEDTVTDIKESLDTAKETIIKENNQLKFELDETFIVKELEKQFTTTSQNLRQDIDRKLGTHGLFLKQMDEKLEKVREKTDVQSIVAQLRDEFEFKLNNLNELTERIAMKQDDQINKLIHKLKDVDRKIDIMSETATLSSISNLIAEFGAGFSSELQYVKEVAMAIDNRLKGLTGEVDLSSDAAIESIGKAVNSQLENTISKAIMEAQMPKEDLQALVDTITQKLELLGRVFDAKTSNLESRVHDVVKEASAEAFSSKDFDLTNDIQELKDLSESLASRLDDLKNVNMDELKIDSVKEDIAERIKDILGQAKELSPEDQESEGIHTRAEHLQSMSQRIAEKLDQLYSTFDERSDILEEKVDDLAQSELEELMTEFSQELEDLRGSIQNLDTNTRETIKIQGISSQEVLNGLREDLTASVEEVIKSIKDLEKEGKLPEKGTKLISIKEDISEKAELLKNITDKISGRMENLFDNINEKTSQLEQKVDILAQTETDSSEIINHLLADFETDLNGELKRLRDMLGQIENKLNDPIFTEVTSEVITQSILDSLEDKVLAAVNKTNQALVNKIAGIGQEIPVPEVTDKEISPESYDATIQGDISYIKDVVSEIHGNMPAFNVFSQ